MSNRAVIIVFWLAFQTESYHTVINFCKLKRLELGLTRSHISYWLAKTYKKGKVRGSYVESTRGMHFQNIRSMFGSLHLGGTRETERNPTLRCCEKIATEFFSVKS